MRTDASGQPDEIDVFCSCRDGRRLRAEILNLTSK